VLTDYLNPEAHNGAKAAVSLPHTVGFTNTDLDTLNGLRASALAGHQWGRAQIVQTPYADYMAAWGHNAGSEAPPSLTIARFKRTGTYALTIGETIIGTGPNLGNLIPAVRHRLNGGERVGTA
jgi:hypothetical protein